MKRWLTVISVGLMLLLSGCSFFNLSYDTLDYAKDATSFLNNVTNFAAETPPLIKQSVDNQQAADDLKAKLQQMKNDLQDFNNLDVPENVTAFHQEIMEQNNLLAKQIDVYLTHMKEGKLDSSILENTDLLQPVQEITNIIEQIQKLNTQVNDLLDPSYGA